MCTAVGNAAALARAPAHLLWGREKRHQWVHRAAHSTSSSQPAVKWLFQTALHSSCLETRGAGQGNPDCLVGVILAARVCAGTLVRHEKNEGMVFNTQVLFTTLSIKALKLCLGDDIAERKHYKFLREFLTSSDIHKMSRSGWINTCKPTLLTTENGPHICEGSAPHFPFAWQKQISGKLCITSNFLYFYILQLHSFAGVGVKVAQSKLHLLIHMVCKLVTKNASVLCANFNSGNPKPEYPFPLFLCLPWEQTGMAPRFCSYLDTFRRVKSNQKLSPRKQSQNHLGWKILLMSSNPTTTLMLPEVVCPNN